jgi:hypothetical protein
LHIADKGQDAGGEGIGRSLVPMGTLRLRLAQVLPIAEAEGSISYQLVS